MIPFKKVALLVLVISICTFVALFGRLPAFRKGPIGRLNRMVTITIPALLYRLDQWLAGGQLSSWLYRSGHYLMNDNHPLILAFFLLLLFSSQLLFVPAAMPFLGFLEKALTVLLCTTPYFLIYKTVMSKSSVITAENHWQNMRRYPYDHILFQPGVVCRTCGFLKPARSKHCSICNVCTAKHDHHCIWVMNCLGKGNYAYFVAMLLSVSAMLSYGAYLASTIMIGFLQNSSLRRSHDGEIKKYWSAGTTWTTYFSAWSWAIAEDIRVGAVGLLAFLTAPLAWGLFFYHVYLIWAGMTTNESSKWDEWKDDIADGQVFKRADDAEAFTDSSRDFELEPLVDWPATSKQLVVRCCHPQSLHVTGYDDDDNKNHPFSNGVTDTQRTPQWKQVKGLCDIENLYDLGFWDNLMDVLPSK